MNAHNRKCYFKTMIASLVMLFIFCVSIKAQLVLYERTGGCGVHQDFQNGCLKQAADTITTDIECVRLCRKESSSCLGAVLNESGKCYLYHDCVNIENTSVCNNEDTFYRVYKRSSPDDMNPCHNGGTWSETHEACSCPPYMMGDRCETRPKSCVDLKYFGYVDGTHWVDMNFMDSPLITKVKCLPDANFVRTYISYNGGSSNYNATYQEYKDGFYKNEVSFWLGLDNIRALNLAGITQVVMNVMINNVQAQEVVKSFVLKSEADDYAISFGTTDFYANRHAIGVGSCLRLAAVFSAWDRDMDLEPHINLAAITGTGWWFMKNDTKLCNFNGKKPVDSSSRLDYVAIGNLDLTYSELGKDFEYSEWYFLQTIP